MILDRFKLDGWVAVVTGGNRGLGIGIATALAEAGADIVSIQRTDAVPALQEAVARVGRRTLSLTLDLTTDDAAAEALAATLRHYGRVDILVNNAGVQRRASAADVPIADWDAIVAVDLRAVFAVSHTVGREMLRQGSGKIINVTSLLAFQGESLVLACATSKHGVAGLTQALCNEWASYGINVNVIAPGYMDTEMNVALRANPGRSRVIGDRRADSDRTLGHVSGSGRRGILPRVAGLGLRAWSHDRRGWRVACPLATRGYWRRRTARGLQLPNCSYQEEERRRRWPLPRPSAHPPHPPMTADANSAYVQSGRMRERCAPGTRHDRCLTTIAAVHCPHEFAGGRIPPRRCIAMQAVRERRVACAADAANSSGYPLRIAV